MTGPGIEPSTFRKYSVSVSVFLTFIYLYPGRHTYRYFVGVYLKWLDLLMFLREFFFDVGKIFSEFSYFVLLYLQQNKQINWLAVCITAYCAAVNFELIT